MGRYVSLASGDGMFDAFVLVADEQTPAGAPVIIVFPAAHGLDSYIHEVCRDLSTEGFIAVAPDLFWRERHNPPRSAGSRTHLNVRP
ncbi:dienelactone hydrolase family protein [Dyella sp. Tek66A03]|uniref:dienelactone hydrolase family protein n=1 Tax=Dyella sp. Tek66A03 TaxID=3458298 RepID=UPI00403EBB3A